MNGDEKQTIALKNGTNAVVDRSSGNEVLRVRSGSGEIIFEYNADLNKTTVHIQKGDLDFMVPNGNINMVAGQNIRMYGQENVDITSQNGVSLETKGMFGDQRSLLRLHQMKTECNTGIFNLKSRVGSMTTEESYFTSDRFDAKFRIMSIITEKCETVAKVIFEKARNIFRRVEKTNEMRAGRQRTIIEGANHMKCQKAYFKSKDSFNIDGENINLG